MEVEKVLERGQKALFANLFILANLYLMIFLHFSPKLPLVIMGGSPSLLWMAANQGDSEEFQKLLGYLPTVATKDLPSPNPGGLTISQTAMLQNHQEIQHCLVDAPEKLFPRLLYIYYIKHF